MFFNQNKELTDAYKYLSVSSAKRCNQNLSNDDHHVINFARTISSADQWTDNWDLSRAERMEDLVECTSSYDLRSVLHALIVLVIVANLLDI